MASKPLSRKPWLQRFGWLVFIWLCSVLTLGLVASILRFSMNVAGMKP
jgi:hypothetical protein